MLHTTRFFCSHDDPRTLGPSIIGIASIALNTTKNIPLVIQIHSDIYPIPI